MFFPYADLFVQTGFHSLLSFFTFLAISLKAIYQFWNSFSTLLIFACQSSSFLSHSARIISLFLLSSVIHGGSFSSSIWTGRNRILNDFVYHQSFKCSWIGESQKYLPHSKRVLRSLIHRLLQRMALPIILSAIVIVRRLVYLVLLEVAVGVNVMLSEVGVAVNVMLSDPES